MAHAAEDNHSATPISPSTNDITLEPLSPPASPSNLDSEGLQVYEPIQCYDKVVVSPDSQDDTNLPGGNLQTSLSTDAYSKHTDGYVPPYLEAEKPNWRNKRICCMPRAIFWILIAVLMLAGIGGIVGGVMAGMKSSSSNGGADITQGVYLTTTTSISTSANKNPSTSTNASASRSTNNITITTAASSTTATADSTLNALFRNDVWYRLTNDFFDAMPALDILKNNGSDSKTVTMSSGDNKGQYWQIRAVPPLADRASSPSEPLYYWLSSWYLGRFKRLQVDGALPYMAQANDTHLGQMWQFSQWESGTWTLSNRANGPGYNMSEFSITDIPGLYMDGNAESSVQSWRVSAIFEILDSTWWT